MGDLHDYQIVKIIVVVVQSPKQDREKIHVLHKLRNMEVCVDDDSVGVVGKSIMQDEEVVSDVQDHIGFIIMHMEILVVGIKTDLSIKVREKAIAISGNVQVAVQVKETYMV